MRVADLATLDAGVLFSALLLLGCHGMARGWPAQLGGVAGGGRAAALTRESPTVYAAAASSWKAPCRAWMTPPLPAEGYSDVDVLVQEIITLCEHAV